MIGSIDTFLYTYIYVYGGGSSVWNTLLSHSSDCSASVALPSLTPVSEHTNSAYPSPPQPAPAPLALRRESELQVTQHCTLHLYYLLSVYFGQMFWQLSHTNWIQNGGVLVPSWVWSTKLLMPLGYRMVIDQETACWTCWAGGPPTRQGQGPSLALGRR